MQDQGFSPEPAQTVDAPVVNSAQYQPNLVDTALVAIDWVRDRPFSFWNKAGLLFGGLAVTLGIFVAMNASDQPDKPGLEPKNDLYLQTVSPQSLAGITEQTELPEAVEALQNGIREYDEILMPAMDESEAQALSVMAQEVKEYALLEEKSGKFDPDSSIPIVNLADCPNQMRIYLCVLLRNQIQGIAVYEQGYRDLRVVLEERKATGASEAMAMISRGRNRYLASVLAMQDTPIVSPNADRVVLGLTQKTLALQALYDRLAVSKVQPGLGVTPVEGKE